MDGLPTAADVAQVTIPSLSVLILAGGHSSRMGQDKVWLTWKGLPLVEHVARRLLPLAVEILFSTNSPEPYQALIARLPIPARVVLDRFPGAGPLAGLHAGLQAARHDLVAAVAADMPFANLRLLQLMIERAAGYDAVVPTTPSTVGGPPELEPLHALYRRSCLSAIESHLAQGRRRMVSFLADVRVYYLAPAEIATFDPTFAAFTNVNTPQEWAAATAATTGTAS